MTPAAIEWSWPGVALAMSANRREHWAALHGRTKPLKWRSLQATVAGAGPAWGRTTWVAASAPKPRWIKARLVKGRLVEGRWTKPRPTPAHVRVEPHGERHPRLLVTLTRVGPRRVDPDNLGNAFKAIQDGIALAFGIDDGDETAVEWRYVRAIGPYEVRCRVEVAE